MLDRKKKPAVLFTIIKKANKWRKALKNSLKFKYIIILFIGSNNQFWNYRSCMNDMMWTWKGQHSALNKFLSVDNKLLLCVWFVSKYRNMIQRNYHISKISSTIVFCCIVAWIQPDISGCRHDFCCLFVPGL